MLATLLAEGRPLLADGATGTNLFAMGLTSGDNPELWNEEHPDRILALHRSFIDAGADIILTNSFGGNRRRARFHKLEGKAHALNRKAAEIARAAVSPLLGSVVVLGERIACLSREQGRSREQGAGSREQGAGDCMA